MVREGITLPAKEKLWNPLTKDEMNIIEETAYKILEEVGFYSALQEILNIGRSVGCEVDLEKSAIKFPEKVVKEFVEKAPKTVLIAGRKPDNDILNLQKKSTSSGVKDPIKFVLGMKVKMNIFIENQIVRI